MERFVVITLTLFQVFFLRSQEEISKERILFYDSRVSQHLDSINAEGERLTRSLNQFVLAVNYMDFSPEKRADLVEEVRRFSERSSTSIKRLRISNYFKNRGWQKKALGQSLYFIEKFHHLNEKIESLEREEMVDYFGEYVEPGYSEFISELAFYDIRDGHRVGEVGAGYQARFSSIIFDLFDLDMLYVNDIKSSKLADIKSRYKEDVNLGRIKFIKGRKKSIRMEGKELDKIIIRNSYHHFSKEDDMLQSIKKSLKKGGFVYLAEQIPQLLKEGDKICPDAVPKDEILREFRRNGFKLEGEMANGSYLLMKFSVN